MRRGVGHLPLIDRYFSELNTGTFTFQKREENLIALDKEKTQLKKEQFINEIRNGLGDHIKKNGNKVTKIKVSWWVRLKRKITKLF